VWQHDHALAFKPPQKHIKLGKYSDELYSNEAWALHISKHHPEIEAAIADVFQKWFDDPEAKLILSDVAGLHTHVSRVKDREKNHAERLDIHPWATERLEAARLVYFGIEGCLKADSILTAILKEDRPESVFSVPSVSLWGAPELPKFVEKRLNGKPVVIVPDADWIYNPLVMEQARLCRTYLRRYGLDAYVAAPPYDRLDEGIKGVGDYLGKGDGTLDELMVQERRVNEYALTVFVAQRMLNRKTKERAFRALSGLAAHASEDGVYRGTLAKLAWVMGVDRKQVERGLRNLEEFGAVEIVGSLESRKHYFTGRPELVDPDACVVLAPELCGQDLPEYPLGKLLAELEFKEKKRKRLEGKVR
jgi:hypothetical protein